MCLAIPAQVKTICEGQATISLGGVERRVSLALTPEARVGDYVLVHTGYAIGMLDAEEAAETLRILEQIAGSAAAGAKPSDEFL